MAAAAGAPPEEEPPPNPGSGKNVQQRLEDHSSRFQELERQLQDLVTRGPRITLTISNLKDARKNMIGERDKERMGGQHHLGPLIVDLNGRIRQIEADITRNERAFEQNLVMIRRTRELLHDEQEAAEVTRQELLNTNTGAPRELPDGSGKPHLKEVKRAESDYSAAKTNKSDPVAKRLDEKWVLKMKKAKTDQRRAHRLVAELTKKIEERDKKIEERKSKKAAAAEAAAHAASDAALAGAAARMGMGKGKPRKLHGGARSTAEAVRGLLMNPKDSIEDFKNFFTELGNIYNNGDVGQGLRTHGIAATTLAIKYLPLAGVPGVAAATALEKLQVNKWINILASLIDFVAGKGNLMTFLNALKDLVGDIFNLLKDIITDVIAHPEKIAEGVKSLFKPGSALATAGDSIVDIFKPGYAAQNAAANEDQQKKAEDIAQANEIIQAVVDTSEEVYNEDPAHSFDGALDLLFGGIVSTSNDNRSYEDRPPPRPQPPQEIRDAIKDFQNQDSMTRSKGGVFQDQVKRAQDSVKIYDLKYWDYLRDHFEQRPEIYKDPKSPNGKPILYNKQVAAPIPGHPESMSIGSVRTKVKPLPVIPKWTPEQVLSGADYKQFYTDFSSLVKGIRDADTFDPNSPEFLAEEARQKEEVRKRDADRAEYTRLAQENNSDANRVKRANLAVRRFLDAINVPYTFTEGEGPYKADYTQDPAILAKIPINDSRDKDFAVRNSFVTDSLEGKDSSTTDASLKYNVDEWFKYHPKPAAEPKIAADAKLPTLPVLSMPTMTLPPLAPQSAPTGQAVGGHKPHHAFHHIKRRAFLMGRRARIDTLDPFFFEGTVNGRLAGSGKRSREDEDEEPTEAEIAAANARVDRTARAARAAQFDSHLSSIEEKLNALSQEMFGKPADALDDKENKKLDRAFRRQDGDESEEDSDEIQEVIMKAKPTAKQTRNASKFMRRLKAPARIAAAHQYNSTELPRKRREYNKMLQERRAAPGYSVPSDEDDTEFELDSASESSSGEEAPRFEYSRWAFKRKE
jgi:hypothetical protein